MNPKMVKNVPKTKEQVKRRDEIELGVELYMKHLNESKQALATQNIMIETPQEPITLLKNPFEDILERAKKLVN